MALVLAVGIAGCGGSSKPKPTVADRCAVLHAEAIRWAQNFEAPLSGTQAQIDQMAAQRLAYEAAQRGLSCYF